MKTLIASDIKLGATYRAKKPIKNGWGEYNDRTIIYLSANQVQYDGVAVKIGQTRPVISMDKFLSWAGHEIADDK